MPIGIVLAYMCDGALVGGVEFMLTAQAELDPVRISADRLCDRSLESVGSTQAGSRVMMFLWRVMYRLCYRRTRRHIRGPQKRRYCQRLELQVTT